MKRPLFLDAYAELHAAWPILSFTVPPIRPNTLSAGKCNDKNNPATATIALYREL